MLFRTFKWAKVRGILDSGDPKTQLIKLVEEQGELAEAILKNNKEEYDFLEFTDQYDSLYQKTKERYLGIGLAIKK